MALLLIQTSNKEGKQHLEELKQSGRQVNTQPQSVRITFKQP
jgi:hypothetical protein